MYYLCQLDRLADTKPRAEANSRMVSFTTLWVYRENHSLPSHRAPYNTCMQNKNARTYTRTHVYTHARTHARTLSHARLTRVVSGRLNSLLVCLFVLFCCVYTQYARFTGNWSDSKSVVRSKESELCTYFIHVHTHEYTFTVVTPTHTSAYMPSSPNEHLKLAKQPEAAVY